jgi:hypothetical protein
MMKWIALLIVGSIGVIGCTHTSSDERAAEEGRQSRIRILFMDYSLGGWKDKTEAEFINAVNAVQADREGNIAHTREQERKDPRNFW